MVFKGKNLLFHWRGGYLTKEIFKELVEVFTSEANAKNKTAFCSVNWAQAVLSVRFCEGITEDTVEIEEVNEGEMTEFTTESL